MVLAGSGNVFSSEEIGRLICSDFPVLRWTRVAEESPGSMVVGNLPVYLTRVEGNTTKPWREPWGRAETLGNG